MLPLIFLALGLIGTLLLAWRLYKRDNSVKDSASTVQAVLTAGALVLAGYWYFVERKGEPHADVSQSVTSVALGDGNVAVEAHVAVKNLGTRLLTVRAIDIRLQQVAPEPDGNPGMPMRDIAGLGYDQWPVQTDDKVPVFNEAELQWPLLRWFKREVVHDIEPGETDIITASFIVPCSIRVVRVATQIAKQPDGPAEKQRWWKARSIVPLSETCKIAKGETDAEL